MNDFRDLDMAVVELHDTARLIERDIGRGSLSEDIRKCANRLQELIKIQYTNGNENYEKGYN
jgi:hypothetical protein